MSSSRVFLGLGSNVEREAHLATALEMLAEHLVEIRCSTVFESASVGCSGPAFFNLVIAAETHLSLPDLINWLKEIEAIHGRRSTVRPELVTLDIDILTYGDWVGNFGGVELPRPEILQRSYVLLPLALLAPESLHPQVGKSFSELWLRSSIGPPLKRVMCWEVAAEDRSLKAFAGLRMTQHDQAREVLDQCSRQGDAVAAIAASA